MKKYLLIGFLLCAIAFLCISAQRQQNEAILISGGFGGEPKLKAIQPDQTANWIEFDNFALPSSGIVPVVYGGTGTNSIAGIQAMLTNAPTSGITAIANGGTGTNSLGGIGTLGVSAGLAKTNDTTWFDAKGSAAAVTNGGATIAVFVVFTGTNGLFYTNRIINGIVQ